MNKAMAFLRWHLRDTAKTWSFWGFVFCVVGIMLGLTGFVHDQSNIPGYVVLAGLMIIVADAVRSWFKLSYQIYQNEQQQIERQLRGPKQ